jgi:hypothetical protein
MSAADSPEAKPEQMTTWPDLAMGLYDRLTGRNAVIEYEFEDMHVDVPSGTGADAEHAHWHLDGKLTITTRERE